MSRIPPCLLAAALAGGLELGLGAGARLAFVGDGGLRLTQVLRGVAMGGLRRGLGVGRGLAVGLGPGEPVQELLALLGDHRRQPGQSLDLRPGLAGASVEGADLLLRAGRALRRALPLDGDGRLALDPRAVLAFECDELGLGLGETRAQRARLLLGRGKLRFQRVETAERLDGRLGLRQLLARLGQRLLDAAPGVGDAREPGLGLARLALHAGQGLARRSKPALAVAPQLAQAALLLLGGAVRLVGRIGCRARGLRSLALHLLLPDQQPKAAALAQPAGGGDGALRGGDEAVPAPQIALDRDQALPGPQDPLQARSVGATHDADLLQPARQLLGGADARRQGLDRLRQGRIGVSAGTRAPVRRGRGIGRSVEVVAQRGGQRQLVAGCDLDLVEHRRKAALLRGLQELGEGFDLGLDLAGRQAGRGGGIVPGLGLGGGGLHRLLRRRGLGLDGGDVGHQPLADLGRGLELGRIGRAADDLARLLIEGDELAFELGRTLAPLAEPRLQALAVRPRLRDRAGQLAQARFRGPESGLGLIVGGERLLLELGGELLRARKRRRLGLQARQRLLGLDDQLLLAGPVALQLREPALQLPAPLVRALGLALEVLVFDLEAVQDGALRGLLLAQGLDPGGRLGFPAQRLRLGLRGLPEPLQRDRQLGLARIDLALGVHPVQIEDDRVEPADLAGQLLVAARLARLALQALDLRLELAQDVVEAREVVIRRPEAQLGLVPAAVQAGDARRVLQDAPALLGLGVDDLANLALAHQRRRARAGGGVLEQDAHVAGAHLLAVEAVGRAGLALDAAGHVERLGAVELRRRLAILVVDEDRHLGGVAPRTIAGAGEDHVVHGRRAHALVRGLAHHPAQRLQQVGLAAAIWADDARQTLLDQEARWARRTT